VTELEIIPMNAHRSSIVYQSVTEFLNEIEGQVFPLLTSQDQIEEFIDQNDPHMQDAIIFHIEEL
jgi:hypothetical protein